MAYAFDERFDSSPCQSKEDEPNSDSTAVPRRDPLSRAGSEQASPTESKNPFRRKSSSASPISLKNPFRKDGSSSSVSQLASFRLSRNPLPREDSSSSIPPRKSSSLAEFFEDRTEPDVPYSDWDFQEISRHLKVEQQTWSKAPRLYTVLRLIGELPSLDKILDKGFSDYWFPFDHSSVPTILRLPLRERFLDSQRLILTMAVGLEKSETKEHAHFGHGESLPFEVKGRLGRGGFATVDRVFSTFSRRDYARKRFRRGKGESQTEIENFKRELQILKRINHHHCVELVMSYTDTKYIGLVMSPVADCNLAEFYDQVPNNPQLLDVLRRFYGCLATALKYLHGSRIRHRDIKPENILVKGGTVYLADFGISLNWENMSSGTTTEDTGKSWVYCAPEVAEAEKRNESSDTWSLGCVFFEMTTVLKGRNINDMRQYLKKSGNTYRFYRSLKGVEDWSRDLRRAYGQASDDIPLAWSALMMQFKPSDRVTANDLCAEISYATHETNSGVILFSGECCIVTSDSDSTTGSATGSETWANNDHTDGTSPPISPLTSRAGTDRSVDPAKINEGPGVDDSPTSGEDSHPWSPTIEVTAFEETPANPLSGLEGSLSASPPRRKKLMHFPIRFKARSKETITNTQDMEQDAMEDMPLVLSGMSTDIEAKHETSEARNNKGMASEVSALLQAARSRRLSSSSDISAMARPILAWRPRMTSDTGLGIGGVRDSGNAQDLQPLPVLGPLSWTKPYHLLDDVKSDPDFMSFLESNYEDSSEYVSAVDPRSTTLLVTLLLSHGLQVESWKYVDSEGASPTFAILDWGQEYRGVLMLMIKAGAKLLYETQDGSTPMTRAAARGYTWAIDILVEAGVSLNSQTRRVALVDAAMNGQLETVKHLIIDLHAVPDQRTTKGKTALRAASSKGHVAIVRYLLETFRDQIDVEARFKNHTPMLDACFRGDVGTAKALLDYGADPNGGRDLKTGNVSYLHHAVRSNHTDIVQLLIDYGADITARSVPLNTPLDEAKKKGNSEIMYKLLEAKAVQERMKKELQRASKRGN